VLATRSDRLLQMQTRLLGRVERDSEQRSVGISQNRYAGQPIPQPRDPFNDAATALNVLRSNEHLVADQQK